MRAALALLLAALSAAAGGGDGGVPRRFSLLVRPSSLVATSRRIAVANCLDLPCLAREAKRQLGLDGPEHELGRRVVLTPAVIDETLDKIPYDSLDEIDDVARGNYEAVNNGVYRCGFAGTQPAYEEAYEQLFERLDWLSERLSHQRYLVGDTITEADVRLWPTLVRFDAVYHGHFKANRSKLSEMPVLWAYARDLFQTPGFGDTIDFDQIKSHYYEVHRDVNPTGIVPKGPDLSGWMTLHHREQLGGRPFGDGTPPPPPPEHERVTPASNPAGGVIRSA